MSRLQPNVQKSCVLGREFALNITNYRVSVARTLGKCVSWSCDTITDSSYREPERNHLISKMLNNRMTRIGLLVVCCGLCVASCAAEQPRPTQAMFWKQRVFFIPYQAASPGELLKSVAKVQLLTSRTGSNDWQVLEEAEPRVRGFSYHAPEDGEYWFALRHLDRRGEPWPSDKVEPQLRVVVDTEAPELSLEGTTDSTGEVTIRYEARDTNLHAKTLLVEVSSRSGKWSPLQLATPDTSQPNRLVGRVRWRPPAGGEGVQVRAAITDRAGRRTEARTKIVQPGPALGGAFAKSGGSPGSAQFGESRTLPQLRKQDWPASNRLSVADTAVVAETPPQSNPYTTAGSGGASRTRAKLIGDGQASQGRSSGMQTLRVTPLGPDGVASAVQKGSQQAKGDEQSWGPVQAATDRIVNSRTFDIEYELESVGPWGVSKVEIWGTRDNGKTWQSYGVDPDNRSPFRVTVDAAGVCGFRILVDGANSAGAMPPQSGDQPELTVQVDLQPPAAELLAAELGQGDLAGHLLVRWTASDSNLETRPIALFYSSYPNGPWSTIASGLENSGSYTWRIERHVPGRFFLRLEARDTAGNLATFQNPTPIELARPQPMGRLRAVRPVTDGVSQ